MTQLIRCHTCDRSLVVIESGGDDYVRQAEDPLYCDHCVTTINRAGGRIEFGGLLEKLRQRVHDLERHRASSRRLERMEHRINGFERELRAQIPKIREASAERIETLEDSLSRLRGQLDTYIRTGHWRKQ